MKTKNTFPPEHQFSGTQDYKEDNTQAICDVFKITGVNFKNKQIQAITRNLKHTRQIAGK